MGSSKHPYSPVPNKLPQLRLENKTHFSCHARDLGAISGDGGSRGNVEISARSFHSRNPPLLHRLVEALKLSKYYSIFILFNKISKYKLIGLKVWLINYSLAVFLVL
jgi:hypothetical protein